MSRTIPVWVYSRLGVAVQLPPLTTHFSDTWALESFITRLITCSIASVLYDDTKMRIAIQASTFDLHSFLNLPLSPLLRTVVSLLLALLVTSLSVGLGSVVTEEHVSIAKQ